MYEAVGKSSGNLTAREGIDGPCWPSEKLSGTSGCKYSEVADSG